MLFRKKLNLKTMQVGSHLTPVAWVSCASLAGAPHYSPSQLLAFICLLQFSILHSIKLARSTPSKPFLPTHPPPQSGMDAVSIGWKVFH